MRCADDPSSRHSRPSSTSTRDRPSRPCRQRRRRAGAAGQAGDGSDVTWGATDGRGPMTTRPATNPLNDVSVGAPAHCYADAGRNRQFVFNMRGAPPASWVDVQSLEHRPAATSSVIRLATMHCLDLCPILGERQHRTFTL